MRFSLYNLMLVLTLFAVIFAWLYDHRTLSERNRKSAAEIVSLQKEKQNLKKFADAARAEIKTLGEMIRDHEAAREMVMRELNQLQRAQSANP